jgi:transcriptional antiterminator
MAVEEEGSREYLIMGKGVGFGKKVSERVEVRVGDTVYSLQENTGRGNARKMVETLSPVCLEISNEVLNLAEKEFHEIDRNILFPMADHIEYAVRRIQNHEEIGNPLNSDIRILFHMEYKVAEHIQPILRERLNIEMCEDEIGYVALHIHSAIKEKEEVAQSLQIARAVRECIDLVEKETGRTIDVMSLSYNRLMNHVRYMVARTMQGEKLKLSMNDYMEVRFPETYQIAENVCRQIGESLKCKVDETEIGYLAMHIERVKDDVEGE